MIFKKPVTHARTHARTRARIYINIYLYICLCMCCVCMHVKMYKYEKTDCLQGMILFIVKLFAKCGNPGGFMVSKLN